MQHNDEDALTRAIVTLAHEVRTLTLDRSAFVIDDMLNQQFGTKAPDSPVMSIDFMSQYLTLGSIRARVNRDSARTL